MRKPLSIAMLVSVGLHATLLSLAVWKTGPMPPAPPVRSELIVSLDGEDDTGSDALSEAPNDDAPNATPQSDGPSSSGDSVAVEVAAAAASLSNDPAEAGTAETEAVETPAQQTTAEATASTVETSPIPIEQDPIAPASILTTAPSSTAAEPLSKRQRKMLDRKIRGWTETYHGHSDSKNELTWRHKGQEYTAKFAELPADDDMALDRVVVEVSTEQDGDRVTTELHMKRLAFSSYAQFVNRWDDSVQIHDDELDGRFHSNSAINLAYSRETKPQFHGKVTTSARSINITESRGRVRRDQVFLGGLQTGVRSIRLPKNFIPLPETAAFREDQVQKFDEDTRITFHEDGSYTWISFESGLFERRATLRKPASYLIATGKAKLHVKGNVNGKVLLYSPERIVVVGDLVYARDPERVSGVDDFIGLVSAKNVEIASAKITGPGDLRITAAIYAKRRFFVRDYRSGGDGLLSIYGSLTAGSLSATEPRFATKIRFDPRLESHRPPGFPVTDRYEVESWNSAWTVSSNDSM